MTRFNNYVLIFIVICPGMMRSISGQTVRACSRRSLTPGIAPTTTTRWPCWRNTLPASTCTIPPPNPCQVRWWP